MPGCVQGAWVFSASVRVQAVLACRQLVPASAVAVGLWRQLPALYYGLAGGERGRTLAYIGLVPGRPERGDKAVIRTTALLFKVIAAASIVYLWMRAPARADEAGAAASIPAVDGLLSDYVQAPDDSFGWKVRQRAALDEAECLELTLTSQTWRGIMWRHQLFVIKPAKLRDSSRALFLIAGGNWRPELADPPAEGQQLPGDVQLLGRVAEQVGTIAAVLKHVPQQPMFDGMVEDEIISYTFEQCIRTRDFTWPLLLPMVKSAARGMDAVQQCCTSEWNCMPARFTVTGASKRGWTTWLVSAVDRRVEALAPMVIDVLNMGPQMQHQLFSFGRYSEQIEDYTRRGIQGQMATPLGRALTALVDPYSYRQKLVQPKLILLGTNDRYWPLDALNLYWDGLDGEKHVVYVPNRGHKLDDPERVLGSLAALHRQAMGELKLAALDWKLDEGAGGLQLEITSDIEPAQVTAWTATAPTRDFRDAQWEAHVLERGESGWKFQLDRPARGFAAVLGEARYETDGWPYYLSTNVRIISAQQGRAK